MQLPLDLPHRRRNCACNVTGALTHGASSHRTTQDNTNLRYHGPLKVFIHTRHGKTETIHISNIFVIFTNLPSPRICLGLPSSTPLLLCASIVFVVHILYVRVAPFSF